MKDTNSSLFELKQLVFQAEGKKKVLSHEFLRSIYCVLDEINGVGMGVRTADPRIALDHLAGLVADLDQEMDAVSMPRLDILKRVAKEYLEKIKPELTSTAATDLEKRVKERIDKLEAGILYAAKVRESTEKSFWHKLDEHDERMDLLKSWINEAREFGNETHRRADGIRKITSGPTSVDETRLKEIAAAELKGEVASELDAAIKTRIDEEEVALALKKAVEDRWSYINRTAAAVADRRVRKFIEGFDNDEVVEKIALRVIEFMNSKVKHLVTKAARKTVEGLVEEAMREPLKDWAKRLDSKIRKLVDQNTARDADLNGLFDDLKNLRSVVSNLTPDSDQIRRSLLDNLPEPMSKEVIEEIILETAPNMKSVMETFEGTVNQMRRRWNNELEEKIREIISGMPETSSEVVEKVEELFEDILPKKDEQPGEDFVVPFDDAMPTDIEPESETPHGFYAPCAQLVTADVATNAGVALLVECVSLGLLGSLCNLMPGIKDTDIDPCLLEKKKHDKLKTVQLIVNMSVNEREWLQSYCLSCLEIRRRTGAAMYTAIEIEPVVPKFVLRGLMTRMLVDCDVKSTHQLREDIKHTYTEKNRCVGSFSTETANEIVDSFLRLKKSADG